LTLQLIGGGIVTAIIDLRCLRVGLVAIVSLL